MKTSGQLHILAFVLPFCFSCCALAQIKADISVSASQYAPKAKPTHRLAAFDGVLLGFDRGEWGGALVYVDKQGRATQVYGENIRGIAKSGDRILVFSGLAHMGINRGKIIELNRTGSDVPVARELVDLHGAPSDVRQVDEQTVAFRVFANMDREGKITYACKSFADGVVADGNTCATGSGK